MFDLLKWRKWKVLIVYFSPSIGLYHTIGKIEGLPYPEAVFDGSFFRSNPKPFYKLVSQIYPERLEPTATHRFFTLLHNKVLVNILSAPVSRYNRCPIPITICFSHISFNRKFSNKGYIAPSLHTKYRRSRVFGRFAWRKSSGSTWNISTKLLHSMSTELWLTLGKIDVHFQFLIIIYVLILLLLFYSCRGFSLLLFHLILAKKWNISSKIRRWCSSLWR